MRRFLLASTAVLALSWSPAQAGGVTEVVVAPVVVAQTTTSSSGGGYIVPLLILIVVAALVSNSGGGGGIAQASDIRLKTDIRKVGVTHLGLPLYQFRYTGLPDVFEGVMAQDVAIMHPNAIRNLPYGYMAVDYAKLGLTMRRVA